MASRKVLKYEDDYKYGRISVKDLIIDKIRKELKYHPEVDLKLKFYMEDFATKNQQCQFMDMTILIQSFLFYNKNKDYDINNFKFADIDLYVTRIKKREGDIIKKNDENYYITMYRYLRYIYKKLEKT